MASKDEIATKILELDERIEKQQAHNMRLTSTLAPGLLLGVKAPELHAQLSNGTRLVIRLCEEQSDLIDQYFNAPS